MSNPFGDSLNTGEQKVAGEKDTLGGFKVYESGLYAFTIDIAYAGKADSGANSMTYVGKLENGDAYTFTEWVTAGTAKGGKAFTVNDKGEASYLPGYNRSNAICLFATEKELGQQRFEDKVIKKYSKAAQAEVNTTVPAAIDLAGKTVILAIQKQIVNKQKKNESTGNYENINEKIERNEVDRIFQHGTRKSLSEALAKSEAQFADKWLVGNDKPRDRYKHNDKAPASGTPGSAPVGDKPTNSLFS